MCQLELYKTFLYSREKYVKIKDFKLENVGCLIHPSPNIEPLYTKHPLIFPHSFIELSTFCSVGSARRATLVHLSFRSRGKMYEDSTSFWVLKCSVTGLWPRYLISCFQGLGMISSWSKQTSKQQGSSTQNWNFVTKAAALALTIATFLLAPEVPNTSWRCVYS